MYRFINYFNDRGIDLNKKVHKNVTYRQLLNYIKEESQEEKDDMIKKIKQIDIACKDINYYFKYLVKFYLLKK